MILKRVHERNIKDLAVSDTSILEFYTVLRARGLLLDKISSAITASRIIMEQHDIREVSTISSRQILRQISLEMSLNLDYFDAMIAASTEMCDQVIISDDDTYDRVGTLKRVTYKQYVQGLSKG